MFTAMIVYLLLVLIRPQDYPQLIDSIGLPLQPIALLIAAGFWMLSPRKNFEAPQYPIMLVFLFVLMVSHVFNGWAGGAIKQFEKFAPVVLAFVVFANGIDRRERVLKMMALFSVCAAVLSLHGIEQKQTGLGWTGMELSQGTRIQYVGIFNDPNDLGLLFVACVPMAVYLSSRVSGLKRLFWRIVAGILVYGVYLTDSRGSLLGMLATMGIYIWQTRGVVVAGVLGLMGAGALLALPSRFSEIDVEEASAQGRVDSWYEGLQMFREHPILGVGPDMYSDYHHLTAHNSFVLILAETGIIGFTLWLAFVIYCFRMMWAASREHLVHEDWPEDLEAAAADGDAEAAAEIEEFAAQQEVIEEGRKISLTLLLSLAGFFICAFFLSRSYVVILYLLAALVVAHYTNMRQYAPQLPEFSLSQEAIIWPIVGVGGAIGLYVVVKILLVMQ
ncbi:MAG: O-antigen ligase family protein [Lysobacteraceae bacterium]|nr:MAG: O-antigen ligase family protein [Xanthomonadaceae bacterium]